MFSTILILSQIAAAAGDYNSHGFYPIPSDGELNDPLEVYHPNESQHGNVSFNLLMEHTHQPLVFRQSIDGIESDTTLVNRFTALHVGASYSPLDRLTLTASMPWYLETKDIFGSHDFAVGDLRLSAPVNLYDEGDEGAAFSVIPFIDLPIATGSQYLSSPVVSGGALLAGGYNQDSLSINANVGPEFIPNLDFYNQHGGVKIISSLGAGYILPGDDISINSEVTLRSELTAVDPFGTASPSEVSLFVRGHDYDGTGWVLGTSTALTKGVGAADYRFFAGLSFSFGVDEEIIIEDVKEEEVIEEEVIEEEIIIEDVEEEVVDIVCDHKYHPNVELREHPAKLLPSEPVYFDFDEVSVKEDSYSIIAEVAATMMLHPEITTLLIHGSTDERGSITYNLQLSNERAWYVMNMLIDLGIDSGRLSDMGYGEGAAHIESCQTEECHAGFRTVTFLIVN